MFIFPGAIKYTSNYSYKLCCSYSKIWYFTTSRAKNQPLAQVLKQLMLFWEPKFVDAEKIPYRCADISCYTTAYGITRVTAKK